MITWLGYQYANEEQAMQTIRYNRLLQQNLKETDRLIQSVIYKRERAMTQIIASRFPTPSDAIRTLIRGNSDIKNIFMLDADKQLLHPPALQPLSRAEQTFLQKTQRLRDYLTMPAKKQPRPKPTTADLSAPRTSIQSVPKKSARLLGLPLQRKRARLANSPADNESWQGQAEQGDSHLEQGWLTWFWERGLNLLYFQRDRAGNLVGIELDRAKLIADIIAELPENNGAALDYRIALLDGKDELIYQWGRQPRAGAAPLTTIMLSAPLSAWKLQFFTTTPEKSNAVYLSMAAAATAVLLLLTALAFYLHRESGRDMREARQRMNFVNQVSHELRTPLTNIRMYAELLDQELDDEQPAVRKRLNIIVGESQRLSRLIGNVLTFARQKNRRLQLHPQPGIIDACIENVIKSFSESFDKKSITIAFDGHAGERVLFDGDCLEQILNNLISNVEKYACTGRYLAIASSQQQDLTTIIIEDDGPGISKATGERIFHEFYRADNSLTNKVAGTGIGLTIARDLARKHQGDLILLQSAKGAKFQLQLHTPKVSS